MARTVGTRELKTRLGTYLRLVKAGRTLVVTERGRPVAMLSPLERGAEGVEAVLAEMAARGEVTLPTGRRPRPIRRAVVRGRPVSESLIEDREDRF